MFLSKLFIKHTNLSHLSGEDKKKDLRETYREVVRWGNLDYAIKQALYRYSIPAFFVLAVCLTGYAGTLLWAHYHFMEEDRLVSRCEAARCSKMDFELAKTRLKEYSLDHKNASGGLNGMLEKVYGRRAGELAGKKLSEYETGAVGI